MYVPAHFAVTDPEEIAVMLGGARLGALVTHGTEGFFASHLPFLHDPGTGSLIGHIARANPHHGLAPEGAEALVIFQGPEAYVSPGWYASKSEHGRVVPTWNYEAVHAHGRLGWFEDERRLRAVVEGLTDRFEAGMSPAWKVSDAPEDHVRRLLGAIVGIEVRIEKVIAKRKLSQNRSLADREGVILGLEAGQDPSDAALARRMRALPPEGA